MCQGGSSRHIGRCFHKGRCSEVRKTPIILPLQESPVHTQKGTPEGDTQPRKGHGRHCPRSV